MSDKMRPIPFDRLMEWILAEYEQHNSVFGVRKFAHLSAPKKLSLFQEQLESPCGPAAGPHTQLAQNIIAAYVAGGRFFELKTVQILDGDDLPVAKPCILADDECYNVEWSTELYVGQALEEYIKGWFALNLLSAELELGDHDGFIFNMSVGYDLNGIKTKKIDDFIEGLKNAAHTEIWQTCKQWTLDHISRFKKLRREDIERISPRICDSITLSTLHGCPPDEIERIATYLIEEKNLNTFIKCNPTLLGYEYARKTLDSLGFDYIAFDDHHFKADLSFGDAVPMFHRLTTLAAEHSLAFGVKLTNTFPVQITNKELPGEEMYMSGRSLFPLSMALANRLSQEFDGKLRISYSGGADINNIDKIFNAGIWPITMATTLLKPGGYERLTQITNRLANCEYKPFTGVDLVQLRDIIDEIPKTPYYRKPIKPQPERKMKMHSPLLNCYQAPCQNGCPFSQDIPAYLRLAENGQYLAALRVITERNPLPFITGTICSHRCMNKCTRDFYEKSVHIRSVKLAVAEKAYQELIGEIKSSPKSGDAIAIIGGGPAGLAAAYFLAKQGRKVTIFEKRISLGGIVRHVIPQFRIRDNAILNDIALITALGVEVRLNSEINDFDEIRKQGFKTIIVAAGAWKPGVLQLKGGHTLGVLEFLEKIKYNANAMTLGANVIVIGGGNTAMDAARAAKRVKNVQNVSVVYRRTKRFMPADEEELQLALTDGVTFYELLAPNELTDGRLKCSKMTLGAPDESGRRRPIPTDEIVELPADTVIAAIGDQVDTDAFHNYGIAVNKRNMAIVNQDTMASNLSDVYVIGDARRGPATVAEAIADALKCATAITGAKFDQYEPQNVNSDPSLAIAKKGDLYSDVTSVNETKRCLECATICECCADVCPNRANVVVIADGKRQIVHMDSMCNECGNCAVFCPYTGAPYQDKFTLFSCEDDFSDSNNQGFVLLKNGSIWVRLEGETIKYSNLTSITNVDIRNLIEAALAEAGKIIYC
jgi:putative selenate reductase